MTQLARVYNRNTFHAKAAKESRKVRKAIHPLLLFAIISIFAVACNNKKTTDQNASQDSVAMKGTFGFDRSFLTKYKDVIVLGDTAGPAKVLIVKDYQGRVMTSTANGDTGNSYGWINYDLIRSGVNQPHFNPFGGEDRFWLGPEGGQYAVFFKKGVPFDFQNWQTPALIDTEPFDLVFADHSQATFKKSSSLTNYQGYTFHVDILRQIRLLNEEDIQKEYGISTNHLKAVAFESKNSVTNTGQEDWKKKNGLISIWILGMFNPSDESTIILPHERPGTGKKVTDNYFGVIPSDRIAKTDSLLLLKGDGRYRGKVGIPPSLAKNIAGSYDAGKHILTLVKFDVEKNGGYVNSKWEMQNEPYQGDAVNAYNDGPLAQGAQLGPFYEIESSSPAKELKKGETLTHRHITLHLEGDEAMLDEIARKTLGVSLPDVARAFKN